METVEDLRTKLIALGLTPQEAEEIKGKTNLLSKVAELEQEGNKIENLGLELPIDKQAIEAIIDAPEQTSPEWQDYVMSLFKPNELSNGAPKAAGMRRICELLLGTIRKIEVKIVAAPDPGLGRRPNSATATCNILVEKNDGTFLDFTDAADATSYNIDRNTNFSAYLTAMAATRARSRTLRLLLGLEQCSAEEIEENLPQDEMTITPETDDEFGVVEEKFMTATQFNVLKLIARKINLNLFKYVNSGKSGTTYNTFNEIPYEVVSNKIVPSIQKYQQKNAATGEISAVPANLVGYDENETNSHWVNS